MDIGEMHVWFRQYAQQMGMQNVRAILPEQIDILINTSITDTVNEIIRTNIGITNDRIITDNSKIGQINALKFLYKVKEIEFQEKRANVDIDLAGEVDGNYDSIEITINDETKTFTWNDKEVVEKNITRWLNLLDANNIYLDINKDATSFVIQFAYPSRITALTINAYTGSTSTNIYTLTDSISTTDTSNFIFKDRNYYSGLVTYSNSLEDYLFLVDFSIDYVTATRGFKSNVLAEVNNNFVTNLFPIRLIDDSYLADTLNDFILKPRLRSPIMVIYNNNMDIYLGKLNKDSNGYCTLDNNLVPKTIRMSYIAKPAKVQYTEDINGMNVNCDLPDYMHVDILKHAVDLYRQALSGGISTQQNQEQAQQQENVRNNYRNEGYQQ